MIKEDVMKVISSVMEPEQNIPVSDLQLIEEVSVTINGKVTVKYHCVTFFCPAVLVLATGLELKEKIIKVNGVSEVSVILNHHYMAEKINEKLAAAYNNTGPAPN